MASAWLIAVSMLCTANLQRFLVQGETPTPKFLTTATNVTVNKGSVAVLPCAVQNIGTQQVVWRRDSSPNPLTIGSLTFTSDSRISVHHRPQSSGWNLHIKQVSPEDADVYMCTLPGRERVLSRAVSLTVQDTAAGGNAASKSGIRISGPQFVEEGHALRLVCNATGAVSPPNDIDWFKDGVKVTREVRLLIAKTVSMARRTLNSVLYIDTAEMTDAGTYVCRTSDLQITSTKVFIIKGSKEEGDAVKCFPLPFWIAVF
ncbi:hemicentin-2-like isoform X2 [Haliotis rubra]|uniref:hemicentin-2-like isoform X2 n=1 Tax=Haliotis rubra TaxID=36100 RepID=UPI001EE5A3E3|nr:hemicentin-2-like isoform X2 [Haliotis rubra]